MARIKCKYEKHYCYCSGYREEVQFGSQWWCDSNDGCPDCKYIPSRHDDQPRLINPRCKYSGDVTVFFEKQVKNFELETGHDGYLRISGKYINLNDVALLEIDEEVIIREDKAEGDI